MLMQYVKLDLKGQGTYILKADKTSEILIIFML
jgi:hypothetical protein